MNQKWKHLVFSLFASLLFFAGCAQSASEQEVSLPVTLSAEQLDEEIRRPLTAEEVHSFLLVLSKLPGKTAPSFVESELPRLDSAIHLDSQVPALRASIQGALSPTQQVESWKKDRDLQQAFTQIKLRQPAFAMLMIRISTAWSAMKIGETVSLESAAVPVETRINQLISEINGVAPYYDPDKHAELLQSLEQLVMLSEFIRILRMVPESSVQLMKETRGELEQVLPQSPFSRDFLKLVEAQAAILRNTPAQ
ncbi:hypothetical protein SH668x_003353 [Planctomicrobium sp. SH668]|uniref:hypothetical protein n=1 Tax=Planctomicrobium sp. SH668 TaxID=3448126 RepID=UPI003F5B19AB